MQKKILEIAQLLVTKIASRRHRKCSGLAWQELSHKLRSLILFAYTDSLLSLRAPEQAALSVLLSRAQAFGPDEVPWLTEGIGHYAAQQLLGDEVQPLEVLGDAHLPGWSLGTLHTGVGMALAVRCQSAVKKSTPDDSVAKNIERFLGWCNRYSRPGYTGMAAECLGFVLRFLHPWHLSPVDTFLQERYPDLVSLLWHGVGRSLYFLPSNLVPGHSAPWRAFRLAEREAPHELARQNLLAGLAWPFLLVTWQQPSILEAVLIHHGELLCRDDCFSSGLSAAMMMWVDCTDSKTRITGLLEHRPDVPQIAGIWESQLVEPCRCALDRTYPLLKKANRLDEIFRYPLPEH